MRPIFEIARDIRADWTNVNYAAAPYLSAMEELVSLTDRYFMEQADMIVRYFKSNASSWKGPVAREIKAEIVAGLAEFDKAAQRR